MKHNLLMLILATGSSTLPAWAVPPGVDTYGGCREIKGSETGYFHVEKFGPQWLFVTPEGHGLYPLTVAAIYFNHPGVTNEGQSYTQVIEAKYRRAGDRDATPARERWANKVRDRLRQWGFSAIGPYSYPPVVPDFSEKSPYYRGCPVSGLPENTMPYAATQSNMESPMRDGVVHNLWSPLMGNSDVGTAMWADVFDPKFAQAVRTMAAAEKLSPEQRKWVLFAFVEQTDYMRGVSKSHPHLGWACAATNFEQPEGVCEPFLGKRATYADPKVYTKYALRDFLRAKYPTLEALNTAWGTRYTTWDSAGGWGRGTGLLDEDGRSLGPLRDFPAKARAAVAQDLDAFAAKLVRQFFRTVYEVRKQACPEILLSTNNFGEAHEYFLKGLVSDDGRQTYADVICCSDTQHAAQWYAKLKRPFFVVSIFGPQAPNDSPLGYRGTVKKVTYEDVLNNGQVERTDDPGKTADQDVDGWKSRLIVQADGVDFWWAGHKQLKIPYRTFTQFSSAMTLRTPAGEFKDIKWPSRPWGSLDWLAKDMLAVHQEIPFGYHALKRALKPGDQLWRYQPGAAETQEGRAVLYRQEAVEFANARADDGDYIYVGFNYWAWWDTSWLGITWDEAFNCGLVTFHDNAYDGREAVFAKGTDQDGYPIGGEPRPPHIGPDKNGFGDFITGLSRTNREVQESVIRRVGSTGRK
jgi:hypothetical protein